MFAQDLSRYEWRPIVEISSQEKEIIEVASRQPSALSLRGARFVAGYYGGVI